MSAHMAGLAEVDAPAWLRAMSPAELCEAAIWLQEDARYLYAQADKYRGAGRPGGAWVATKVQENAAHSAALARAAVAMASGGPP